MYVHKSPPRFFCIIGQHDAFVVHEGAFDDQKTERLHWDKRWMRVCRRCVLEKEESDIVTAANDNDTATATSSIPSSDDTIPPFNSPCPFGPGEILATAPEYFFGGWQ